jgi:hypothetical protein
MLDRGEDDDRALQYTVLHEQELICTYETTRSERGTHSNHTAEDCVRDIPNLQLAQQQHQNGSLRGPLAIERRCSRVRGRPVESDRS